MPERTSLQIKGVFPEERARPVVGIPLEELKKAARGAEAVRWFNGSDLLAEISAKDFRRRLDEMRPGCHVVVMAKSSRSNRAFPAETGYSTQHAPYLDLNTHFRH